MREEGKEITRRKKEKRRRMKFNKSHNRSLNIIHTLQYNKKKIRERREESLDFISELRITYVSNVRNVKRIVRRAKEQ